MNKSILVLVEDYPDSNGKVSLMYVHTRNVSYIKEGFNVTVLSFRSENDYEKDGIRVICLKTYKTENIKYDALLLHAPNIKHHYKFLKKYHDRFEKLIFFYHGHEVLKINKVYSKPYKYMKSSVLKRVLQNLYDDFKLFIWRHYLPKLYNKSFYIFVSVWMKNEFVKWTKLDDNFLKNKNYIIYNGVGEIFENNSYFDKDKKQYDFITIRSFLDGSKYGVDIVNRLAKENPKYKFLVVGTGHYFDNNKKSDNIDLIKKTLNHNEIIEYLNKSRFALMPTRTDAQGLMMCEMAAFGIPVITSDIPVCHEIFDNFPNAYFISNDNENLKLDEIVKNNTICIKDTRFYKSNTSRKEIDTILNILS